MIPHEIHCEEPPSPRAGWPMGVRLDTPVVKAVLIAPVIEVLSSAVWNAAMCTRCIYVNIGISTAIYMISRENTPGSDYEFSTLPYSETIYI